ncbi:hypothetical protein IE53DRAFT_28741 [Violaceomyces palustris]|uniref:Uncharacterized protein n=1 Tax=Violaceomyces palustris TaxID=1673888 RepID=A0ACD0P1Q3_9BASI|nr:hypothetical protein IE53DRAFT_28741 [Violaceomyces palustris]
MLPPLPPTCLAFAPSSISRNFLPPQIPSLGNSLKSSLPPSPKNQKALRLDRQSSTRYISLSKQHPRSLLQSLHFVSPHPSPSPSSNPPFSFTSSSFTSTLSLLHATTTSPPLLFWPPTQSRATKDGHTDRKTLLQHAAPQLVSSPRLYSSCRQGLRGLVPKQQW